MVKAVSYPNTSFPLQHAEKQLQLPHSDAVAGQDSQHVHEQVY